MKKTGKWIISWTLSTAMVLSAGSFLSSPVRAEDSYVLNDSFDTYGPVGSYMVGRADGWEQVTEKSWQVAKDPDGGDNLVGESVGTAWITNRKTAPLDKPLVISGRLRMDKGALGIGLRSIGNESMLNFEAGRKISFYDNVAKKNVDTGASWVQNQWMEYILCLRSNADPTQSKTYLYLRGPGASASVTGVNCNFDLTQYKYAGTLVKFDSNGAHYFVDDMKLYNAPTLDLSIPANTNVGASVTLQFNHPIDPDTLTKERVHVTKNGAKAAVSSVQVSDDWQSATIAFGEALSGVYKVQLDLAVKDVARNSASNAVYFSTDSTTPPDSDQLPILVEGIRLEPDQLDMRVGFTENFQGLNTYDPDKLCVPKYTVLPATASNQKLEWISEDPSIAAIDKDTGNITPLKEGITQVYAKSTDGGEVRSAKLTVNVGPRRDMENQKLSLSSADAPRIDKDKFLGWPQNVGDTQVALWADNCMGAFTMTVDDGISQDFDKWNQLTDQYKFPFTFFVPGETLLSANLEAGVPKLIAQGQNVESHTQTHVSTEDQAKFSSGWWMEDFGHPVRILKDKYGIQAKTLGYSYGTAGKTPGTAENADYMREYYIAARGATGNINPGEQLDYNYISSASMTGAVKLTFDNSTSTSGGNASMEGMVKSLYDDNYTHKGTTHIGGWACIHAHGIDATGWAGNGPDGKPIPADNPDLGRPVPTGEMLQYVFDNWLKPASDAGKVWVDTFTNVAMYAQSRDTSKITSGENTNEKITFYLTDQMDDRVFDYPLTVKVRVPDSWNNIGAVQNGRAIEITPATNSGQKYVMVKAVPDGGLVSITPDTNIPPEPITDLSITSEGNLEQEEDNPQAVTFTARTTPGDNVDLRTIGWYVNGAQQEEIGLHFTYQPQVAGEFKIQAKVSESVVSNEITIRVAEVEKATPAPKPDFTGLTTDVTLMEDDFNDYALPNGNPAVGKNMPVDTHGDRNPDGVLPYKWNGGNEDITVGKRRSTFIVNNPDGTPGDLAGFQFCDASGTGNLQLNREAETIRPGDTLVLSGRIRPTALKNQDFVLNLRQTKVKTLLSFWLRESGDTYVRAENNQVVTKINLNEWTRYNIAVTIGEDLSQCPFTVYLSGGVDGKDQENGALLSGTLDMNAGITDQGQKFDFATKSTKITYHTNFPKGTLKAGMDATPGEEETKYDGIYHDDVAMYKAGTLAAAIPQNAEVEDTVTLYTNHDMKIGAVNPDAFTVSDSQGGTVAVQQVIYDKSMPSRFTLKFAQGALKAGTQYKVAVKETATDFMGNTVGNQPEFTTKQAPAEEFITAVTYTMDGVQGTGTFTVGTLRAEAKVTANVSNPKPATLIAAQFEDGQLTNVNAQTMPLTAGVEQTIPVELNLTKAQGTVVKLMLWDVEGGVQPLREEIILYPAQ